MASVILEGADGTGKTTLAKIIAAKYGWDICHCTAEDPKDYEFYRQTGRKQNVVWDRHTIGELIYPSVFNREPQLSAEEARLALAYAREAGAKIFVLTAAVADIRYRLIQRGEEYDEIWKRIEWINDQFLMYADCFNIPVINTSGLINYNGVFNMIESRDEFNFIHK